MGKLSGILRIITLVVALITFVTVSLTRQHEKVSSSNSPNTTVAAATATGSRPVASAKAAVPADAKWVTLYDINKVDALAEAQSTLLFILFLPLMIFFLSTTARQINIVKKALLLLIGLGFAGIPILYLWAHFSLVDGHNKGPEEVVEGPVEDYKKIPIKDGYQISFKINGVEMGFETIPFHGPGLSRLSDEQQNILSHCKAAKAWIPKKWGAIARLDVVQ